MKRLIAIAALFALIFTLASCSVEEGREVSPTPGGSEPSADAPGVPALSDDELSATVLVIDGSEVSLAEVRYQAASLMSAYAYYGDGGIDWSEEIEGVAAGDFFIDEAVETCKLFRAVERYAAENGYALTDDELSEIQSEIDGYIDELGGEEAYREQLALAGMTEELYEYLVRVPKLYYKVYTAIYGEGGEQEITDATVESYFEQNYLTTRHILKFATDESGGYLPEDETAAILAETEALLERIESGEDFAALAESESDDDELYGDTITFELGTMPEPYVAAAQALGEGETSGVVDIDGAYVIIMREALDTHYLEEHFDAVAEEYGLGLFRVTLDEAKEGLEVTETADFALVDVDEIYSAFFGQ